MTKDEAKARWICCPLCDKKRCERGADDVLDKIRAEIEAEPYISKMEVLDIIDKYRTESEVRNDT